PLVPPFAPFTFSRLLSSPLIFSFSTLSIFPFLSSSPSSLPFSLLLFLLLSPSSFSSFFLSFFFFLPFPPLLPSFSSSSLFPSSSFLSPP
ncbi:hypothetical protein ACXWRS_10295, partial [Streptococcus pyogenes]